MWWGLPRRVRLMIAADGWFRTLSRHGRIVVDAPRKTYRPWDPDAYRRQTHSPAAKLPEGDLVFFLLDVVPALDLGAVSAPYEDQLRGAPPFDPRLMTCLWLYAYAVGVFSSRKLAAF